MEARNQNDSWAQECWERTTPCWSQRAQQWALIYCWGKLQSEWGDGGGSPLLKPIISSVFPRDVFTTTRRLDVSSVEKKEGNRSVLSWGIRWPSFFMKCSDQLAWSRNYCHFLLASHLSCIPLFFISSFWCEIMFCEWKTKKQLKEENMFNWCEPSLCLQIACESTWAGLFHSCCLFHWMLIRTVR